MDIAAPNSPSEIQRERTDLEEAVNPIDPTNGQGNAFVDRKRRLWARHKLQQAKNLQLFMALSEKVWDYIRF